MRTDRSKGRIISRDKEAEEQRLAERDKHRLSGEDLSRAGRDLLKLRAEAFQTCSSQEGSHRSQVASGASNVASVNGDVYVYTKNMLDFKDLEKRM